MSERFQVVETNPNDSVGGGGCVCSESKVTDCKPPYAVFFHQETNSGLSPHVVICKNCAEAVVRQADKEVLAGGEKGEVIEATAVEEDDEDVPEL